MTRPSKTPIRLTRQRAEALLGAAALGADIWEAQVRRELAQGGDAVSLREAKARDLSRSRAIDAMAIVSHRYLDTEAPVDPTPTLFETD